MNDKNEKIILSVSDMTNLGHGVARKNGRAVFVRGGVTGDTVEASIIKKTKSYDIAAITRIIEPSAYRRENDCPVFRQCGGCSFRNITYEYERELKKNAIKSCFVKEGLADVVVADVEYGDEYHYRNKAQYPVARDKNGKLFLGFYGEYSHKAVDSTGCLTESAYFTDVKKIVADVINDVGLIPYDETTGNGLLRHIYLRTSRTGDVRVCFVVNAPSLPHEKEIADSLMTRCDRIKSVSVNINRDQTNVILGDSGYTVAGDDRLQDILCGKTFGISDLSFWQVNGNMAERLYNRGRELIAGSSTLLDLYCGIGSIGLCIAADGAKLMGVDIVPDAIKDARVNAMTNHMSDAVFVCGDADSGISECIKSFGAPDTVCVDPPRKGISDETADSIISSRCDKILYISCNPATLARDTEKFVSHGYNPGTVYPFDLFPRTGHVESCVLLTK